MRRRGPGQGGGETPPLPPVRWDWIGSQTGPIRPGSSPPPPRSLFTTRSHKMMEPLPHKNLNPFNLPDELIVAPDPKTIRQIADLAGFGDVPRAPCDPPAGQVGVGSVRFQYGRHFVLFVRVVKPGSMERLHAILVPKSRGVELADALFAVFLMDFGNSPVMETPSPLSSSNN